MKIDVAYLLTSYAAQRGAGWPWDLARLVVGRLVGDDVRPQVGPTTLRVAVRELTSRAEAGHPLAAACRRLVWAAHDVEASQRDQVEAMAGMVGAITAIDTAIVATIARAEADGDAGDAGRLRANAAAMWSAIARLAGMPGAACAIGWTLEPQHADAVAAYAAGVLPVRAIRARYRISTTTLSAMIDEAGVPRRRNDFRVRPDARATTPAQEAVLAQFRSGRYASMSDIARRAGVSLAYVSILRSRWFAGAKEDNDE